MDTQFISSLTNLIVNWCMGDVKVTFIPTVYKNTIVCYSWSKSLSLPGERIGYVCVPDQCDHAKRNL